MSDWEDRRETHRRHKSGSIFGPLLLIAVGTVLLLKTLGVVQGDDVLELLLKTWPLIFIVGGLDSLYRGDSYVGGVVWTGFGVILLLGNLGYLPVASWTAVLRLWPFLLVVWGLDLLFGRQKWWVAALGVLAGFGVLAVMFWMLASTPLLDAGHTVHLQTQRAEVTSAQVSIEPVTADLWVGAGSEPSNIAEVEAAAFNLEEVSASYFYADGEGDYSLTTNANWYTGVTVTRPWTVKLNRQVPLELTTRIVVGEQTVNLSGLQISESFHETIIGKTELYLPASGDYQIDCNMVMGEMVVYVLPGTPVEFDLDTGMTAISYPDDYVRSGDHIYSPQADAGKTGLLVRVDLPMGNFRVETVD